MELVPENFSQEIPAKPRVLLAASGSVAAIKFSTLCCCFVKWGEVKAVATKSSLRFIDIPSLPSGVPLYTDEDDWSCWQRIGDGVLHIELRKWADMLIIAPLSANTLAKVSLTRYLHDFVQTLFRMLRLFNGYWFNFCQIAGGLCDNLLTCIVRAWDYGKPLYVAPSMNTFMLNNTFTVRHLNTILELGALLIPPTSMNLSDGDLGNGAMAEPSTIFTKVMLTFTPSPANDGGRC
ncbi:putative phosphopantothenoylcysteine decarboxylase [Apostasia shenzhenica]|uniref:phosphopantothenoylcysteine decarboxylase n=1 Tax=Apostasia shenzhenica TaxID=1088818 RepID=A0A2I0AG69_9ASPA|nr:putative phosphopantothenoylcysteine decarboxylase [Apostasia shenzhenica]